MLLTLGNAWMPKYSVLAVILLAFTRFSRPQGNACMATLRFTDDFHRAKAKNYLILCETKKANG